jgi:hypothetical protein
VNEPQNIQSGQGLLKDSYDEGTPISNALKRRRQQMEDKVKAEEKPSNA